MLRDYVYDLLKADATMNGFDINGSSLYPMMGPLSPAADQQRFMVLRWGNESPRLGRDTNVTRHTLMSWMYNREPDYASVDGALRRVVALLLPLGGQDHGDGYILDVEDNGCSEDLYDPTYEAVMRNWTFTITASES